MLGLRNVSDSPILCAMAEKSARKKLMPSKQNLPLSRVLSQLYTVFRNEHLNF